VRAISRRICRRCSAPEDCSAKAPYRAQRPALLRDGAHEKSLPRQFDIDFRHGHSRTRAGAHTLRASFSNDRTPPASTEVRNGWLGSSSERISCPASFLAAARAASFADNSRAPQKKGAELPRCGSARASVRVRKLDKTLVNLAAGSSSPAPTSKTAANIVGDGKASHLRPRLSLRPDRLPFSKQRTGAAREIRGREMTRLPSLHDYGPPILPTFGAGYSEQMRRI